MTRMVCLLFKHKPSYLNEVSSDRNYPYYYMWKNLILSLAGQKERFLKGYKPSVKVTYYYGLRKPLQFHGARWEQYQRDNGGVVKGVDAGHWLMRKHRDSISNDVKEVIRAL